MYENHRVFILPGNCTLVKDESIHRDLLSKRLYVQLALCVYIEQISFKSSLLLAREKFKTYSKLILHLASDVNDDMINPKTPSRSLQEDTEGFLAEIILLQLVCTSSHPCTEAVDSEDDDREDDDARLSRLMNSARSGAGDPEDEDGYSEDDDEGDLQTCSSVLSLLV